MDEEKLRLFTAVRIPREQLAWLDAAAAPLKAVPGARWTALENQHVTLNFIGWLGSARLAEVVAVLDEVASAHAPAPLALDGLGAFRSERRARVLWAGLADPDELLRKLAGELGDGLRAVGYVPEDRAYVPHLTLARFKTPRSLAGLMPRLHGTPPPFEVDRVTLYRSRLSPGGARYEVLHEAYLTGNRRSQ